MGKFGRKLKKFFTDKLSLGCLLDIRVEVLKGSWVFKTSVEGKPGLEAEIWKS